MHERGVRTADDRRTGTAGGTGMRRAVHDSEGAAAVEFSLIAILLFTLLLGILQFGLAYNRQQGLHAAAREGARLASLGNTVTDAEIRTRVAAAAPAFILSDAHLAITIVAIDEDGTESTGADQSCRTDEGDDVVTLQQVRIEVDITPGAQSQYDFGLPLIGGVSPDLSSTATFQCEQERT